MLTFMYSSLSKLTDAFRKLFYIVSHAFRAINIRISCLLYFWSYKSPACSTPPMCVGNTMMQWQDTMLASMAVPVEVGDRCANRTLQYRIIHVVMELAVKEDWVGQDIQERGRHTCRGPGVRGWIWGIMRILCFPQALLFDLQSSSRR